MRFFFSLLIFFLIFLTARRSSTFSRPLRKHISMNFLVCPGFTIELRLAFFHLLEKTLGIFIFLFNSFFYKSFLLINFLLKTFL